MAHAAHAMLVQMVQNMCSTCDMSLIAAQSMAAASTCPFLHAAKGRVFNRHWRPGFSCCMQWQDLLSDPTQNLESLCVDFQHALKYQMRFRSATWRASQKKLPSFHQESLTLKRNCLEIFLLLLGVLFLVILVFLFSFLFILWHFNLLQGSIWIHTKLLRHQLVHMSHK